MDNYDDIFNFDEQQPIRNDYSQNTRRYNNKKKIIYIAIAVFLICMMMAGSFIMGMTYVKNTGIYEDMPLLIEAYQYLKQYYYQDISWEEFQVLAAKGVIGSVDKYTGMYEYDYTTGSVALGITISTSNDRKHIISGVIPNAPAARAIAKSKIADINAEEQILGEEEIVQIEIGDRIYGVIQGIIPRIVEGQPLSLVQELIAANDIITLLIQKSDGYGKMEPGYYKFIIEKEYIKSKKAFYYNLEGIAGAENVGLIKLDSFTETAAEDFLGCVDEFLLDNNKSKLILDLRGNGGGDSQILGFISACLLKGAASTDLKIAFYKYNAGNGKYAEKYFMSQRTYTVSDEKQITAKNLPSLRENFEVAILCDGGSASCSEVIIGALNFYNGSKTIGTKTYGKGVAQSQIPLSDNKHYVVITNGKYFIPTYGENGETLWEKSIHEVGFTPDVELFSNQLNRPMRTDPAITNACEILTS